MKLLMKVLVLSIVLLGFYVNAHAITLSEHILVNPMKFSTDRTEEWKIKDHTGWLIDRTGENNNGLGTGGCIGPFYNLNYDGKQAGDLLSLCALATVDQTGTSGQYGGINVMSFHGLQVGAYYDPFHRQFAFDFGVSVKDAISYIKQLW